MPTLSSPEATSLASLVQQQLEHQILSGERLPGEKLVEEEVASRLNVSRGPVREAFRALEQAGLVTTEPHRGVFVRRVSLADADEIYEVRAGLDALVGRVVARRITASQLAELRDLLARMEVAARTQDVATYHPLNMELHDAIVRCSGNRTLIATYRSLVKQLHLYRRETLARGVGSFPTSLSEHHSIVDALATGEAELAGSLLYEHAIRSRERLHATLEGPAQPDGRARRAPSP
jgi:phosphonate utilization transcriptional regulator